MSRLPPVPRNHLKPIPDGREQFSDIRFPILGVDISEELESQRPGTSPLGQNVRACEPLTLRMRGGSRPGLSKFLNEQVAAITRAAPEPIQNLTIVVDPSGVLIPFPFNDVAGEFFQNTLVDISNLSRGTLVDGSLGDVYPEGSGFATNRQSRPVPKLTITADDQTKVEGSTFTFAGTEFDPGSGIATYQAYAQTQVDAAQSELDKRTAAEAKALAAYNANPTDATLAYYNACLAQTIKATAALSAAQALKIRADAATVTTVTLTSEGAASSADAGSYPIRAKSAQGTNLDLFRIKYVDGTMTVSPAPAITFIQAAVNKSNAGPTTCAFSSSVTAGNLLVVFWGANFGNVTAVTDTLGNTYTLAGTNAVEGSARGRCYYTISGSSGANTVTVTSGGNAIVVEILEYEGIAAVSPVINYQRSNNNSSSDFLNLHTPSVQVNTGTTTLAADITTVGQTSITVTSSASFPSAPFTVKIDSEQLRVSNVAGTTWTVSRAFGGTTAATHSSGATVTQYNTNLLLGFFCMDFDVETFTPMASATVRCTQNDGLNYEAGWVEEIIDHNGSRQMTGLLGGLGALNGAPAIGIAFKPA